MEQRETGTWLSHPSDSDLPSWQLPQTAAPSVIQRPRLRGKNVPATIFTQLSCKSPSHAPVPLSPREEDPEMEP